MRKSLLAVAALMGVAVLPQRAEAVAFRVAEDISGNMGFRGQIWGQIRGERLGTQKGDVHFELRNVRLYANGNVGKHMFFGANLDFGTASARATDAFIGLRFQDELRVQAGVFRTPFSRETLTDSYTYLIPTGYFYGDSIRFTLDFFNFANPPADFTTSSMTLAVGAPLQGISRNRHRNAGITIWGEVGGKDVPFKYYIGVFDGPYNNTTDAFGKDNLMYSVRFQFTPTMLGFKGERGYGLRDTQLGRQNVLSFGVGYSTQKCGDTRAYTLSSANINTFFERPCDTGRGTDSFTTKAWTVDIKHEQKFGKTLIAGWEAAYFDVKDVNIYRRTDTGPIFKDDRKGYYLQVHAIYDKVVGIGKPAIAVRYDEAEHDFADPRLKDAKYKRWGVGLSYFLKGQDAQIQLAIDRVDLPNYIGAVTIPTTTPPGRQTVNAKQKDYTDITLAFQVQF